jgi:hypothetical protein
MGHVDRQISSSSTLWYKTARSDGCLMDAVMERTAPRHFAGVRLVRAAYHCRSLSLHTKLDFDSREPLSTFQGAALKLSIPGYAVRPAREADLEQCARLCSRVHGHNCTGEMREALRTGHAAVVERTWAHHWLHFRDRFFRPRGW